MGRTRIFTTEEFDDFAADEKLDDDTWVKVVIEIERGLIGADLGGSVLKKRVARRGAGKSGGYRTIIVFRREDRAVFVKGYSKNAKSTLSPHEARAFREIAKDLLELTEQQMDRAVAVGRLREIDRKGDNGKD